MARVPRRRRARWKAWREGESEDEDVGDGLGGGLEGEAEAVLGGEAGEDAVGALGGGVEDEAQGGPAFASGAAGVGDDAFEARLLALDAEVEERGGEQVEGVLGRGSVEEAVHDLAAGVGAVDAPEPPPELAVVERRAIDQLLQHLPAR